VLLPKAANCFCAVSADGSSCTARISPTQVFGAAPEPEKHKKSSK
jgi:hypothetical protein